MGTYIFCAVEMGGLQKGDADIRVFLVIVFRKILLIDFREREESSGEREGEREKETLICCPT